MSKALYEEHSIFIHNTLSGTKEKFESIHPGHVGLYVCGPTVYNDAHLGNVRTFLTFDIVYRYLIHLGYKVRYVRNITDVGHLVDDADSGEDKIEKRARFENIEPMEIVQKYTNGFHDVTRKFNLIDPSIEPTATGHIIEQIDMVQRIIDNGLAYEKNGSVYFDVAAYQKEQEYGKLSGRKVDELLEQTREDLAGGGEKNFFADFAIWKKAADNAIMKWPSPWGEGVPGWHLECSVMSTKYLGQEFDIHGGGMDLKFPHHECEIAQSVGADGKDPVRYWMHSNMLTVNGTKMSKSLGNAFLPNELIAGDHPLLDKGYSPMTVRFFFLQAHYRSTVDFSNDALKASEKGYQKLMESLRTLSEISYTEGNVNAELSKEVNGLLDDLYTNMGDDFNTAKVVATLFEISSKINGFAHKSLDVSQLEKGIWQRLLEVYPIFITEVLGLIPESTGDNGAMDKVMQVLIELRNEARGDKNWALSDAIRDKLKEAGIEIKDGKEGTSYSLTK